MSVVKLSRPLGTCEMGLWGDKKTNLQPRPRKASTRAAPSGQPIRVEHASARTGALNLLAGCDTRTWTVYATTAECKRQAECMIFVEQLDREIALSITTFHVGLDHVQMHKGQQVHA